MKILLFLFFIFVILIIFNRCIKFENNNENNNENYETISNNEYKSGLHYEDENNINYENNENNKNIITFIIPTIGRESLIDAIESIQKQTIPYWKTIIIFDGIKSNIKIEDNRITIIEIEKKGKNINNAGNVRNVGMELVDTEWIAFLDDDDYIEVDYIETFYRELELVKDIDVLIFRMINHDNQIFPYLQSNNFYKGEVGISFVMRKKLIDYGYIFEPNDFEDYELLNKLRNDNYKIMISPYIKYIVRGGNNYNINELEGNRVIIN